MADTWQRQGASFSPLGAQGAPFPPSGTQGTPFSQPSPQGAPFSPSSVQRSAFTPGVGNLTREERLEAKRLAEEANFSFEGYQVVRREFISHRFDPAMTIRGNSITFNNSCISKLEDATYIQFLINSEEHKMVIRPCDEGARDAIRWCVVRGEKRKSRVITCQIFTSKLYEMMKWDQLYRYKLQGMRINYRGESLYLFDLESPEMLLPQSRDPVTNKIKRPKPILPSEWLESFGLSVAEHTASTQINLLDGFLSSGMVAPENGETAQVPMPQETGVGE